MKKLTAERLQKAVRCKTVSCADENGDFSEFSRLHALLEELFPRFHAAAEREIIGSHSLSYRWRGKNSSLSPLLFCAHMDVVPADGGGWKHPPFEGVIDDGYVYGRGAFDCKATLIALLSAAEELVASGCEPERDIYFAFGHDEEIGGTSGAEKVSGVYAGRGLRFALVLDEGGAVLARSGVSDKPAAFVSVTEKGFLTIRVTVRHKGGHASTPPPHSAVGILSLLVAKVENIRFPLIITPVMRSFMRRFAPYLRAADKLIMSHPSLFRPFIARRCRADNTFNALFKTTGAATMLSAGTAVNVLPDKAEAMFNFRPLHGQSCDDVVKMVRAAVGGAGEVEVLRANEPSAVSQFDGPVFETLDKTAVGCFGDIPVLPYMMTGGTDARKYEPLSSAVFRFCPLSVTPEEYACMHAANERISIDALGGAVGFYTALIKNMEK